MVAAETMIRETIHFLSELKLGAADARMVLRAIAHLEEAESILNDISKRRKINDTSKTSRRTVGEVERVATSGTGYSEQGGSRTSIAAEGASE